MRGVHLSWTSVIGGVLALVAVALFVHTFADVYQTSIVTAGRGPVFFPRILLALMLLAAFFVILQGRKEPPLRLPGGTTLVVLAVLLVTGGYIFAITAAGFLLATIVFTFVLPLLLGYHDWRVVTVIAATYPIAIWYLFDSIFRIVLPGSPWFHAF